MTGRVLVDEATAPAPALFPADSELLVRAPPDARPRTTLAGVPAVGPAGGLVPHEGGFSSPLEFETDLWKGRIQLVLRQPEQAPAAARLLHGRQRQIWVMLQGQLKRPVALDDLQCGSWYTRALHLPASAILYPAVEWLARRLGGGLDLRLRGDAPHIVGNLAAAAQLLNVSLPGQEPLRMEDVKEDTRLLLGGAALAGKPMTTAQRRAYFKHDEHRAGRVWSPDHVITMFYFDHSFNYHTFKMLVPPCFHLDMVKVMDGQPVSIGVRDKSTGEFGFRFEVWHRRMLDWLDTHKARIGAQQANNAALLAAERAAAAPAAAKAPAAVAATVAVAAPAGPEEDAAAVVLVNGGSEGPRSGDGIAGLATGLGAVKLGAGAEGGCDLRTVRDTMVTAP